MNGFEMIHTTPEILRGVGQTLFRSAAFFVEAQSGHFKHFV